MRSLTRHGLYLATALAVCAVVAALLISRMSSVADVDLYEAITHGNAEAINSYLSDGGDPNARIPVPFGEEWRLLRIAIVDRQEDISLALLRAGADLAASEMLFGGFIDAANNGLNDVLEHLMSDSTTGLRATSTSGISGAAGRGYYGTVQLLLRHIDTSEDDWRRDLRRGVISAMAFGYDDIAMLLLEAGADLTGVLHEAVRFSSPGMIRYLLDRGADPYISLPPNPEAPEQVPQTPLRIAWMRWREQQYVADTYGDDATGLPLEYRNGDAAYVMFELIRAGVEPDEEEMRNVAIDGVEEIYRLTLPSERLIAAARLGYLDVVQSLHAQLSAAFRPDDLREAAVVALQRDHDDIARWLLDSGAPADGGLLHVAAAASSPGMVRHLLQLGADPRETLYGRTPVEYWLEIQATAHKASVLHELIVGGAEVCWLTEHWESFGYSVRARLANSAPECW
jgi:ankyrin repeat protein